MAPAKNPNVPAGVSGTDQFWWTYGEEVVKTRVTRIETASEKFVTGIGWFWSVYTASALAGVALADRSLEKWQVILAGVPSLILIVAYLLALWALSPAEQDFDLSVADDIRAKEENRRREKRTRFIVAAVATFIGAATVAVAIAVVLFAPVTGPATLNASFDDAPGSNARPVFVSGRIANAKSEEVNISIVASSDAEAPEPTAAPVDELTVTTSDSGEFSGETDELTPAAYNVIATWSGDDQTVTISTKLSDPSASTESAATGATEATGAAVGGG